MSGGIEIRELLRKLSVRKDRLQDLTEGGISGIINAGRITRLWVNDSEFGFPFLSSTDITQTDLSNLSYIAKSVARKNSQLLIKDRWILITRSGTIGRMAYAREDMNGMACTEDVLRVIPDENAAKSGYIYAYLSSKFGLPIVVSGTYGSIITHLEPRHIADLPVPRLGVVEDQAHDLAQGAASNRVLATKLIDEAINEVYSALGMMVQAEGKQSNTPSLTTQTSSLLLKRMDAYYYSNENSEARQAFNRAGDLFGNENLGDIADVWIPNIFKRLYAEDPNYGCPYFTGKEIYELFPSTHLFLKREVAQNYRLILSAGMILVQDSGQISGLIGRPVQVGKHLEGAACTNNMVRIQTPDILDNGYLFALLSTHYGIRLLKREASGSSIPHLDEGRIKRLAIPWPAQSIRLSIGTKVIKALHLRDEAVDMENKARALVEHAIEEGGR